MRPSVYTPQCPFNSVNISVQCFWCFSCCPVICVIHPAVFLLCSSGCRSWQRNTTDRRSSDDIWQPLTYEECHSPLLISSDRWVTLSSTPLKELTRWHTSSARAEVAAIKDKVTEWGLIAAWSCRHRSSNMLPQFPNPPLHRSELRLI